MSDEKNTPKVPEGWYKARAVASTYTLADDNSGNPRVGMMFEITQDGPHKGSRVPWRSGFGDKVVVVKKGKTSTDITLESLENAGMTNDDIAHPVGLGSVDVEITVKHNVNPKDGNVYAEVGWVNTPGGKLFAKPMDDVKATQFAEQMKAKILLRKQKRGQGLNGSAPASGGAVSEDGIPF